MKQHFTDSFLSYLKNPEYFDTEGSSSIIQPVIILSLSLNKILSCYHGRWGDDLLLSHPFNSIISVTGISRQCEWL